VGLVLFSETTIPNRLAIVNRKNAKKERFFIASNRRHLRRNEPLNICCVITTPYRNGNPGKSKKEYAVNEPKTNWHKTLSDLLDRNLHIALNAMSLYMPNSRADRTGHLVDGTQHGLVGRPDDLTKNGQ